MLNNGITNYDVELVFTPDAFQFYSIFDILTENQNKPWVPNANTRYLQPTPAIIILKNQQTGNLSGTFAFILPHKIPVLMSAHVKNLFS